MSILAMMVFLFCAWAVFSRHFCDGIITKHLFTFSAITAMLVVLDPDNMEAAEVSYLLLVAGIVYWFFKHKKLIIERLRHFHN